MASTMKDWIKDALVRNAYDKAVVYGMYSQFFEEAEMPHVSNESYCRMVRLCYRELRDNDPQLEEEVLEESIVKTEAQKQRAMDLNNHLRKSNRESYRLYNTIEELYKEFNDKLGNIDLSKFKITEHKEKKSKKTGILSLSDIHANELITDEESFGNEYNFSVLSKRMKKYVVEAKKEFKANGVSDVYIFMLGDMLNSSRRLSEKLAMNTALTSATLLLVYILEQVIIELAKDFNIHVSFCVGNESRIEQDFMDSQAVLAATNYDFMVFHILRRVFDGKPVEFIAPKNFVQNVVTLSNGFTALLTHGHTLKKNPEDSISSLMQQYSYQNIKIDGIFCGHFHHCQIGDILSMSGSMCGANSYTSTELRYLTRASQNIYIVNDDGHSYKGIKIDLQDVKDWEGYAINEELEYYAPLANRYNNVVTIKNLC